MPDIISSLEFILFTTQCQNSEIPKKFTLYPLNNIIRIIIRLALRLYTIMIHDVSNRFSHFFLIFPIVSPGKTNKCIRLERLFSDLCVLA